MFSGVQALTWPKIMSTILDDPHGFAENNNWEFLKVDLTDDEASKDSDVSGSETVSEGGTKRPKSDSDSDSGSDSSNESSIRDVSSDDSDESESQSEEDSEISDESESDDASDSS